MIVTEAAVTIPQIKQPTYSSSSSSRSHGSAITTEREAPAAGASYTCEKNVPWIKNNHVITHINVLVASLKLLFLPLLVQGFRPEYVVLCTVQ